MSPDDHIGYAPCEAYYDSFLHNKRQGFRIYPGMVREAN
jgi:hypothetical protein